MEKIKCKCGCGIERERFDIRGRERFYVKGHAPRINKSCWNAGKKGIYSDETIEKMRQKKIGIKLSKEHKEKISDANRKNTDEENYKMKQARWKSKKIYLKESCDICGDTTNLQKHHWNYNKPLLVNTLCQTCHEIQHIRNFNQSKFAGGSYFGG